MLDRKPGAAGARIGFLAAILVLMPGSLSAQQPATSSGRRPSLQLYGATAVPFFMGAEGEMGLGSHFAVHGSLGWLPGPYVDLINHFIVSYGWYDQATADLIDAALQNSLVTGLAVGYRPLRTHGLEFTAGYRLVMLGGASTAANIIEVVTGETMPAGASPNVDIKSVLHSWEAGLGWGWRLGARLRLETSASFLRCFSSSTETDVKIPGRHSAVAHIESESNDYLDGIYQDYVMTGLVRIAVGYQF